MKKIGKSEYSSIYSFRNIAFLTLEITFSKKESTILILPISIYHVYTVALQYAMYLFFCKISSKYYQCDKVTKIMETINKCFVNIQSLPEYLILNKKTN
jgi:hypothetical protein